MYVDSVFQNFESFLGTEIELVEDDVRLVLDDFISKFITYEITPGIYTLKDLSEALFNLLHPEYREYNVSVDIEFDDITMKTKSVVRPGIIAIKFDEKSFFSTILGFTSCWDSKHYIKHISQKIVKLSTTNKNHLKCDYIDGSIQNGIKQAIFYSFVLDKKPGYRVFVNQKQYTT